MPTKKQTKAEQANKEPAQLDTKQRELAMTASLLTCMAYCRAEYPRDSGLHAMLQLMLQQVGG